MSAVVYDLRTGRRLDEYGCCEGDDCRHQRAVERSVAELVAGKKPVFVIAAAARTAVIDAGGSSPLADRVFVAVVHGWYDEQAPAVEAVR